MKRTGLIIGIIFMLLLSIIYIICFSWIFWLCGGDNVWEKWNKFANNIIFNKEE